MKVLEEKLRSRGRIDWTITLHYDDGRVQKYSLSSELISVAADPTNCSLRVVDRTAGGTDTSSIYLEEGSGVETSNEVFKPNANMATGFSHASVEPPIYRVGLGSWRGINLMFPTEDEAEQVAVLLRESIKQCSAVAVIPKSAAGGSPSLEETLTFIADKLRTQGTVETWGQMSAESNEMGDIGFSNNINVYQVSPNLTTCTMRIEATGMDAGDLSFRRIGKIEVLKYKDYLTRFRPPGVDERYRTVKEASPTFVLVISTPDGEAKVLYFSDETLANRVAKAMVHAAELCGAGSSKEPF